jgi:(+)-trans-carveol dehydrogenase
MGRMDGKVALITGGARGMGRAHAIRLAEEGAVVIVTDLCAQMPEVPYPMSTPQDLEETVALVEKAGGTCRSYVADALDYALMRQIVDDTVAEFGRLDTVVINHGIGMPHSFDDENADAAFDATIATNLTAVWRTARAAIPHMRDNGGGSIIATASAAGLRPTFGLPGYVASKHAVIGLVKALAAELAPHWIRVNAVCPGNVATPMLHNDYVRAMFTGGKPGASDDDMVFSAQSTMLLPIPWMEAEAIANGVLYLASDESKYVTGIALPIDAGMSTQPAGVTPYIGARIAELGG